MDWEIPNFILQPLMENCLLHGLKDRRYCGTVTLQIEENWEKGNWLSIWIIDDGIGMSEEKLKELNTYSKEDSEGLYRTQLQYPGQATHLGVVNVVSRLKLYYQEECRIIFSKNKAGGTSVNIQIKTERE